MASKIRAMLKKHLMDDKDDKTPSHDLNEKKKKARKK